MLLLERFAGSDNDHQGGAETRVYTLFRIGSDKHFADRLSQAFCGLDVGGFTGSNPRVPEVTPIDVPNAHRLCEESAPMFSRSAGPLVAPVVSHGYRKSLQFLFLTRTGLCEESAPMFSRSAGDWWHRKWTKGTVSSSAEVSERIVWITNETCF